MEISFAQFTSESETTGIFVGSIVGRMVLGFIVGKALGNSKDINAS